VLIVKKLGEGHQPALQELEAEVDDGVEHPRPVGPNGVGDMPGAWQKYKGA
jgi:hypothetical protein